jgi:Spy/CpxP family protein refolding chaperone
MKFRTAAFVTAAALALATLPAAAQGFGPPGHGPGHGGGNPILHMVKELGLSDAQTAQVKTITAKYMDGALGQAMDSTREARANVMKAVHDVNATDDQVREAASVVAVLDSQIAVQHHQMAIEISAILTADQRAKLADMFANMAERHGGLGRGGPGGF